MPAAAIVLLISGISLAVAVVTVTAGLRLRGGYSPARPGTGGGTPAPG